MAPAPRLLAAESLGVPQIPGHTDFVGRSWHSLSAKWDSASDGSTHDDCSASTVSSELDSNLSVLSTPFALPVAGTFVQFKVEHWSLPKATRASSCPARCATEPRDHGCSARARSVDSAWSSDSEPSDDECEILLGLQDSFSGLVREDGQWRRCDEPGAIGLRDMLDLKSRDSSGCFSVGSLGHEFGECKVCAFAKKGQCRAGVLCGRCHLEHAPFDRKLARASRRQRRRAEQRL